MGDLQSLEKKILPFPLHNVIKSLSCSSKSGKTIFITLQIFVLYNALLTD